MNPDTGNAKDFFNTWYEGLSLIELNQKIGYPSNEGLMFIPGTRIPK